MRVLVTGGAGRLGRSVIAGLAAHGHDLVAVDLAAAGDLACQSYRADLSDPGEAYAGIARCRPDAVVHLAGVAVPFSQSETRIYRTNTQLAYHVHQAAVDLGVSRVITASSPTVVGYGNPGGWRPAYLPLDEEHPEQPWHAYALSKQAAEATMRMFATRHGEQTWFAAFRPCYVVAPEEWQGAPTQAGHTVAERLDDPGLAAASLFNYLDARDAADLVCALLDRSWRAPNGEVFFAGAADALARKSLAELLPEHVPATADAAGALAATQPAFSSAKAQRLLGWRPRRSWRTELR